MEMLFGHLFTFKSYFVWFQLNGWDLKSLQISASEILNSISINIKRIANFLNVSITFTSINKSGGWWDKSGCNRKETNADLFGLAMLMTMVSMETILNFNTFLINHQISIDCSRVFWQNVLEKFHFYTFKYF